MRRDSRRRPSMARSAIGGSSRGRRAGQPRQPAGFDAEEGDRRRVQLPLDLFADDRSVSPRRPRSDRARSISIASSTAPASRHAAGRERPRHDTARAPAARSRRHGARRCRAAVASATSSSRHHVGDGGATRRQAGRAEARGRVECRRAPRRRPPDRRAAQPAAAARGTRAADRARLRGRGAAGRARRRRKSPTARCANAAAHAASATSRGCRCARLAAPARQADRRPPRRRSRGKPRAAWREAARGCPRGARDRRTRPKRVAGVRVLAAPETAARQGQRRGARDPRSSACAAPLSAARARSPPRRGGRDRPARRPKRRGAISSASRPALSAGVARGVDHGLASRGRPRLRSDAASASAALGRARPLAAARQPADRLAQPAFARRMTAGGEMPRATSMRRRRLATRQAPARRPHR